MTYLDPKAQAAADKAYRKASRPFYKKKRFILPAAFLLLLAIIGLSSGGSDPAPTPGAAPPSGVPSAPSAEAAPQTTLAATAYGQTADTGGLSLTVSAPKSVSNTLGAYYCTTVSYENKTGGQVSFNTFDWKLSDTEGVEVSPTFGGTQNDLGSGELRPGGKKTGDVCFQKQGGGTPQSITYTGGLFSAPVQWQKQ